MDRSNDLEALLLDHLEWIERVVGSMCRRNGIWGDDADDFASWVKMRLVEDDYAVFRKFRGESAITTYLTVVISMFLREYRVTKWGRWRPSVAARRNGPVAVRLEMLVNRDGHSIDQAVEILSTEEGAELTSREAAEMLAEFPRRSNVREVGLDPAKVKHAASPMAADDPLRLEERADERGAAEDALASALEELDPEDRLIVKMRFWDGMTVADISRGLHLEQKPLYRRLERALGRLRGHLERVGVGREMVVDLLDAPDPISGPESGGSRLSNLMSGR